MSNTGADSALDAAMQAALAAVERIEQAREVVVVEVAPLPVPTGVAAELAGQLQRLADEFDAFRHRAERERRLGQQQAVEPLLLSLLPVLDNLQLALSHLPPAAEALAAGLQMVQTQFDQVLGSQGVQAVPCVGRSFDPTQHEALAQEMSAAPAGSILREVRRGYLWHERLLRPAQVVVARAPAPEEDAVHGA